MLESGHGCDVTHFLMPEACVGGDPEDDAMALILRGAENRRVSETRMNRESSRSHSVFTCTLESTSRNASGITSIRFSRLNIIDLAGPAPEFLWTDAIQ